LSDIKILFCSKLKKIFDLKVLLISLLAVAVLTTANFGYAQNTSSTEDVGTEILNSLVSEFIAIVGSILALGVSALVAWLRNRGLPITSEQEMMFKDIVTKRFETLAKDSWATMREHPEKIDEYWKDLCKGKIPQEFQIKLKDEGKGFALELKKNREFRDFAKNLTDTAMNNLLKDLRARLKNDYQKQMIDVIPKLASIAVDSAFDPNVKDVETWGKKSLVNLKPLLLSTEAIDTEQNLMLIVKSEINKRIQQRLST
jgi:hypothetical protein